LAFKINRWLPINMGMTAYEIRLELLKLSFEILKAQAAGPAQMPDTDCVSEHALRLNQFVSNKPAD
jgi:hypothetical protein